MKDKMTIGFIINEDSELPAWYFETIQTLIKNNHKCFFIRTKTIKPIKPSIFYRLFKSFEDRWFGFEYDAANIISIHSIEKDPIIIDAINENVSTINEQQPDLIYSCFFHKSFEKFAESARLGFWFIQFGHKKYAGSMPVGFWEVMHQENITGSRLLSLKNGRYYLLHEGSTSIIPYSVKNNFNSIAWKSSSYLLFLAERLIRLEENIFSEEKIINERTPDYNYPGLSMPLLFIKNSLAYFRNKIYRSFNKKRFHLLYAYENFQLDSVSNYKWQKVDLPPGVFHADPFVIKKEDAFFIFFEEYNDVKQKAHISMIRINDRNFSSHEIILEKNYHLSYPFVFFHEGNYYMIPETSSNRTVELYKAKEFPYKWELVMNLMEGKEMIDVTIHFENGKWWLFANQRQHPFTSTNDQLFLYYSNDLFSTEWTAHPKNPIASHINNCRPAGRIFRLNNKLYRPAQNNASRQYGYGLKINEIIKMTETEYEENEIVSVTPDKIGLNACHHMDFVEGLVVIDGV